MLTNSNSSNSPFRSVDSPVLALHAPGFPPPHHDVEPDIFVRQANMLGHVQERVSAGHVAVVGCGGLGGWIAPALARAGVSRLTLIDPDFFDRSNAPRQLMYGGDIGEPKAHALAKNVVPHMTSAGSVIGVCLTFDEAFGHLSSAPDVLVVGVDNNAARSGASTWGLRYRVPVIFAMLSLDGLRTQVFCQRPAGACLACVLPNSDPSAYAPCAAASSASCQLAAAHAVHMTITTLSGSTVPAWRETSLDGSTERHGSPSRRRDCPVCSASLDA